MARGSSSAFVIRAATPRWLAIGLAFAGIGLFFLAWWLATAGVAEERLLSPAVLPSPGETFASFKSLWFDRALTRNTFATLRRVALGFALACAVGIPLGVLAGCFTRVAAFFQPMMIFGRNIPLAALIPLTFSLFGIGETQKIMFIFIACVAFVMSDTANAIAEIDSRYIDTAYTLGAKRRHVILKVLVPLAMPSVFNSLRILFGLAFGYIMLAELVKFGGESGGLGDIIITSQRRGVREHILLVLLLIPLVALVIDRGLFWVQRELFPHRYGGYGLLNRGLRASLEGWGSLKGLFFGRVSVADVLAGPPTSTATPTPVTAPATGPSPAAEAAAEVAPDGVERETGEAEEASAGGAPSAREEDESA
jgi:ABC-type nitrate/sulfonate/bicarbonate transport system permease component